MDKKWLDLIDTVDYAFQPIVNIHSGKMYGLEALIRNYESDEFHSIDSVFDTAYSENVLYKLDMILRQKAIEKFANYEFAKDLKLFYNLDNRITSMPDFSSGKTIDVMDMFDLDKANICFELSEKHQAGAFTGIDHLVLNIYKQQGYKMAIDDFGVGFSGLQMLYRSEPDIIKIDRFFISDIDTNKKKKLFVNSIVEMSQAMGIYVVAEGVETLKEYEECKRLGCNMIQGYFVAKPTQNLKDLRLEYKNISDLSLQNKRDNHKIQNIKDYLEILPTLKDTSNLDDVFEYLRDNLGTSIIPILSKDLGPVGIIKEVDLKQYTYSQFGYSILKNQTKGEIKKFTIPCGIADINDPLGKILKIYSYNSDNGGIIITQDNQYVGYLSAKVILDIVNEKSVLDAKEQNPLTGLNGNKIINEYISDRLKSGQEYVMIYFDFDNFKPYNDFYGFRKGDRVILLFADILKKDSKFKDHLVGHIGGDDFFLAWNCSEDSYDKIYEKIKKIVDKFSHDVESFYDEKDRKNGYINAKNREGELKKFDLLTVSAAAILVKSTEKTKEETVVEELSRLKKSAKTMKNHIALATFLN
ncbi:EAL domain-containing protein [Sulfurospirillum arcachonense]|uniref:EAL domain-containing protein n=1 Tax=Sulfurospirillum arcachonense TaxID=57666 RepID=UPI00046985B8|nr:EAL domain-containing protein [Sulfurospirillum arcachonense]